MVLANQIAGFLNQLFLKNKSIASFLHADTNPQIKSCSKFFLVWHGHNMGLANLVSGF